MLQQIMFSAVPVLAFRAQYPPARHSRMYPVLYFACLLSCTASTCGCPPLGDRKTTCCIYTPAQFMSTTALDITDVVTPQLGSGAGSVPHPTPPIFGSAVAEVHSATHSDIKASGSGRRLDVHVAKDPSLSQRLFLAPNSQTTQFSWSIFCLIM